MTESLPSLLAPALVTNGKGNRTLAHFIGGTFHLAGDAETFLDLAPASDEPLAEVALGGKAAIDAAVQAAQQALNGPWGRSSAAERARMLRRLAEVTRRYSRELAIIEALDTGKPISETLNGDIPRAAANFDFFADLCAHQPSPSFQSEDGAWHATWREPLGVVGLITPWNLPLYLATWKIAPALAQGNAVILKPAELTPLSAAALGVLATEAGLPPGVLNVVQGFGAGSAGEALVRHPEVRAISFTGETTTGQAIMAAAAPTLKKLSFELGGKGATVIMADADLDRAAATAARAAFRNQGQICLAGSRLLVARSVLGPVLDRLLKATAAIVIGPPLAEATTMGSLICRAHRDKVQSYIDHARGEAGVEIVRGGDVPAAFRDRGAYLEPTVIMGVAQDSRLIQEEIFGPVLTVQTFADEAEALTLVNGTAYGLSTSIWTRDQSQAMRLARSVRMGLTWVNCWFSRDLHTAFGGMKASGIGREGGQYGLDFFSEFKTITMAP